MATRAGRPLCAAVAFLFFLSLAPSLMAANVVVPSVEFVTRGFMNNGVFALATYDSMDIAIDGGYKIGGRIAFTYVNGDIEQNPARLVNGLVSPNPGLPGLAFKGMSFILREPFSLPGAFSWFVGQDDVLCSGDAVTAVFGSAPITSRYRGFMYFPTGILYDGIHEINGTGARVDFTPARDIFLFSLYAYQDSWFTDPSGSLLPGYYSGDLRMLANFGAVKIESFVGATYAPTSALGYYRGGLLFYASGPGVEFFSQIGIPKYDPAAGSAFSINLFYLLFEPRLHLGLFSIIPTFFWHPGYYLQQTSQELGSFDVNIDFSIGDLAKLPVLGGVDGTFKFASTSGAFTLAAGPYVSFVTQGIAWDVKVNAKLWPFSLTDLVEAFVGLRAEF